MVTIMSVQFQKGLTVPESRSTVDKISCDAEIEPSVERDPGTVDRLNEAPQCSCPGDGIVVPVYWVSSVEIFACCNCDGFVGSLS